MIKINKSIGQIKKLFVLFWMIVGNIVLPQVFKFPIWVIHNGKLYFSLVREVIDENTHKKHFKVASGCYNKESDKMPLLFIETI